MSKVHLVLGVHARDFLKRIVKETKETRYNERTGQPYEKVVQEVTYQVGSEEMTDLQWRRAQDVCPFFYHEDYGSYSLRFFSPCSWDGKNAVWGISLCKVDEEDIEEVDFTAVPVLKAALLDALQRFDITKDMIAFYLVSD